MLLATGQGSVGNNCSLMILLSASILFTLFLGACFADGSKERETEALLINKSVLCCCRRTLLTAARRETETLLINRSVLCCCRYTLLMAARRETESMLSNKSVLCCRRTLLTAARRETETLLINRSVLCCRCTLLIAARRQRPCSLTKKWYCVVAGVLCWRQQGERQRPCVFRGAWPGSGEAVGWIHYSRTVGGHGLAASHSTRVFYQNFSFWVGQGEGVVFYR